MQPRKYSDKEVGQILSKATALQSGSTGFTTPQGTTLQELQRVAEEVGLDPKAIERAAKDLENARQITASPTSNTVVLEQSVGGSLSDETWDRLVMAVRAHSGSAGKSEASGPTREWIGGSDTESVVLSATNRLGRTQLTLMGDNTGGTALTTAFGGVVTIFATLVPVVASVKLGPLNPWLTFFLTLLVALSSVVGSVSIVRNRRRNHKDRLNGLMDRLVEIAESGQDQLAEGFLSSSRTEADSVQPNTVSN